MALLLDKNTDFGVSATYHRIIRINTNIDKERGTVNTKTNIYVASYLNEQAREDRKVFLLSKEYIIDQSFKTMTEAYDYLKTLPDFSKAIDV